MAVQQSIIRIQEAVEIPGLGMAERILTMVKTTVVQVEAQAENQVAIYT